MNGQLASPTGYQTALSGTDLNSESTPKISPKISVNIQEAENGYVVYVNKGYQSKSHIAKTKEEINQIINSQI